MRPPHLHNDVDASVLAVLKRIVTEVRDLHPVVSDTVVDLLSGALDSDSAHLRLYSARLAAVSGTILFQELLKLMNYFCPVIKETPGNPHPDREYWDYRCQTCITDITRILDERKQQADET